MPRVKIGYIVSFSSEDPDNQASNLVAWEVSKKKWLCSKGEPSCSVVLQLTSAVKISAVTIGAHHAAFVEVLVGRSEKPNEDYQVLVPKSVFLSPAESRRDEPAQRVRSFTGDQLLAPARDQRWDRARILCVQTHNKHCQYGLSFVHIYEPESNPPPRAVPPRMLALDTFSSDEDDFKPGELFAKHLHQPAPDKQANTDTGAQIRQATSQALKNISDSATKLMKTPISKTAIKRQSNADECAEDRTRDSLLYTDDDDRPHAKIDHVVQRHNDQKSKEESSKKSDKKEKFNNTADSHKDHKRKEVNNVDQQKVDKRDPNKNRDSQNMKATNSKNNHISVINEHRKKRHDDNSSSAAHSSKNDTASNRRDENERRKRPRSDTERKKKADAPAPHTLLQGVVAVLSGYQNPRRAAVRTAALALGARVQQDWAATCTHLICAFPNTPKLRAVRASPGGGSVPVVRAEWVEQCAARRRRLPWRWFATEPEHREQPPEEDDDDDETDDRTRRQGDAEPDCDTDEEIEKVLRNQKRPKTNDSPRLPPDESPEPPATTTRHDTAQHDQKSPAHNKNSRHTDTNSISTSKPSRYSIDTVIIDSDSVADEVTTNGSVERSDGGLPDFFDGFTFLIDEQALDERFDVKLLIRYIQAYGGVVIEASQLDEDSAVNYVLCTKSSASATGRACAVRPDWVWRCHDARALLPAKHFALV